MGYYLNPAEMTSMFAVPQSVADKHLRLASAEQLKVLLWCLKNLDKQFDITAVCDGLKLNEYTVRDALDHWCERGVLCSTVEVKPVAELEKKKFIKRADIKPNRDEVTKRGNENPDIAFILRETEMAFGKFLSENAKSTLVWIYDDLGFSVSLIMMIVNHAKNENRLTINYIERLAVEWANDGVSDIESAEQRLILMRRRKSAWHLVETAMGIDHRSPTKAELEMADTWINEWNYGHDIIREAYEVCINTTSKFSIPYIKKVICEWHKAGVKTVEDIATLNTKKPANTKGDNKNDYSDFIDSLVSQNEEDY